MSQAVGTSPVHDSSESDYSPVESENESMSATQTPRNRSARSRVRTRGKHPKNDTNASDGKYRVTKAYRDLVNLMITDVLSGEAVYHEPLGASQVGGAFWTVGEKNRFFTKLGTNGLDDTRMLAEAVRTKSELEVRSYLLLLQDGLAETAATPLSRDGFQYESLPAAYEVGPECEAALESCASELVRLVERQDVKFARDKLGNDWLIDEAAAESIERRIGSEMSPPHDLEQVNGRESGVEDTNERTGTPRIQSSGRGSANSNGDSMSSLRDPAIDTRDTDMPSPVLTLLRPASFILLSRSLFMNSATAPDNNWHELLNTDQVSPIDLTAPAIFRTALDDLYSLAVSLTRRLVQASLFQAMTRLRAKDDSHPVEAVREADVRTATDILRLSSDKISYWAKAARRCGVEVYAEPPRSGNRRQPSKHSALLTYEEVEAELGLSNDLSQDSDRLEPYPARAEDVSDVLDDSDIWTSGSEGVVSSREDDVSEGLKLPVSDNQIVDIPSPAKRSASDESLANYTDLVSSPRKRRKTSDEQMAHRAEDAQLEAMDHRASLEEEVRLWETIGHLRDQTKCETPVNQPNERSRTQLHTDIVSQWRSKTHYEAEWEGRPDPLDHRIVNAMNRRYQIRSDARRRALVETANDMHSPGSETNDVDSLSVEH